MTSSMKPYKFITL